MGGMLSPLTSADGNVESMSTHAADAPEFVEVRGG